MNHSTPGSLSITNSRSSLRLMSIKSVMPSSHLILCRPLLLLSPIPPSIRVYDYTVEVRNRFKGLDLINRVSDELWIEICNIAQETGIKAIPKENKCKKANWLSEEALKQLRKEEK